MPATTAVGAPFDEGAALLESWRLAGSQLRDGSGASFIAMLPAPGIFVEPYELGIASACAMARSLQSTQVHAWSRRGLRFNSVTYGGLEQFAPVGQRPSEEIVGRIPMARLASITDLVDAVRFLASEAAAYVASADLMIDGGMEAYSWFYPVRDI